MDPNNASVPGTTPPEQPVPAPGVSPAVVPNAPYQNTHLVTPQTLPPEFAFIANQPEPASTAPRKIPKMAWIGGGVLLLFIVATIAVVLLVPQKKTETPTTPTNTLSVKTQKIDGIQFSYPDNWQQIDGSPLGFSLAFGAGDDLNSSTEAVLYKKSSFTDSTNKVADFDAAAQAALTTSIVDTLKENITEATCSGFNIAAQKPFSSSAYFGVDITFTCAKNANGVATRELDRYIYTGDGNLYQVSFSATEDAWAKNGSGLQQLPKTVLPVET